MVAKLDNRCNVLVFLGASSSRDVSVSRTQMFHTLGFKQMAIPNPQFQKCVSLAYDSVRGLPWDVVNLPAAASCV